MKAEERFSKFSFECDNGCIEFTGARANSYGVFWYNNRNVYAHRFAWELHNGPIPKDLCVLHKCDNPTCVNPDHLFLGTDKDNVADATAKGRRAPQRGKLNHAAVLTEEKVRQIRTLLAVGTTHREIAEQFRISPGTVTDINCGRRWGWLQ